MRTPVPILRVTEVALDPVQHRVDPACGWIVFVLLYNFVRAIPFPSQRKRDRLA